MIFVELGRFWGPLVAGALALSFVLAVLARRKRARKPRTTADVFADMSPCLFFEWLDDRDPKLKAVGWLAKNSPYKRGKSNPEALQKLLFLLASPWSPACLPRRMECPFCPIINPDHGKQTQPWWVMRKTREDGIELVQTHTPEALAHLEMLRLSKSGAHRLFHSASLFIPSSDFVFVAHPMIAHFVDAHGYAPPAEFWKAVQQCAEMQPIAYRQALIDNGPQNSNWIAAIWAGQKEWDLAAQATPEKK